MDIEPAQDVPQREPPSGTFLLEDKHSHDSGELILHPTPTSDPNDPLNWSSGRKAVNFGTVCFYVLITFVFLDIQTVAFSQYLAEFGWTFDTLNNAAAAAFVGLAIGCIAFIPLVHRYGRRPLYLFSLLLQVACGVWNATLHTSAELMVCAVLSGLGGAISETIVQVTIADLFFVHQHATMNGIFILMQSTGAYLGPVAAGYIVVDMGWRWMWWMTAILTGANLLFALFFFEETKFVPTLLGEGGTETADIATRQESASLEDTKKLPTVTDASSTRMNIYVQRKSYRQRLAFVTKTDTPIAHHFYQPFIVVFKIPAVAYVSLTYGLLLSLYSVIATVQAYYMIAPPYNFDASQIGLLALAPFIGSAIGTVFGGWLNDKLSIWCAKRNGGVFEAETRLYLIIPGIFLTVSGMLMFGLGLAYLEPWTVLAVGTGIYGAGFVVISSAALTYLTDSYSDVIADALVAVTFFRNAFSILIMFTITPWLNAMGIKNLFILLACVVFAILALVFPMIVWGKKARYRTSDLLRELALKQPGTREH
ncbi:sugar transporter [Ilyonectria sp. MPI-CAGE-AT-0026]|nr:sugar transporter [Ilyonectria sp. MPI-CAGE-AT-0026]